MRRIFILIAILIIATSLISAEIIITQQPKASYNFGEVISIPVIVKATGSIIGSFNADLICNGNQINFYKNGISLEAGEEKRMDPSLVLTTELTGGLKGDCKIKTYIGDDYALTNDFTISTTINLEPEIYPTELFPRESFLIKGTATKEGGETVVGFLEAKVYLEEISTNITPVIIQVGTINNGYFELNMTVPSDMKAGNYAVILRAYEKDSLGSITNEGLGEVKFSVKQLATNLEVFLETREVEPGTPLIAKVILHDQTGANIPTPVSVEIKDDKDKLLEKLDITTEKSFEFPIKYNEPPREYKVIAKSSDLSAEATFIIKEKEEIDVAVVNNTLIIKNKGNVPYCDKTILVKIGDESLNLNPCLEVDEEEKYRMTAPDGNYEIEIITDGESITETVSLTGSVIDIKEIGGYVGLSRQPLVWIFVIFVLGFLAFAIYRKGYKRMFIGRVIGKRKPKTPHVSTEKPTEIPKGFLIPATTRAEVCLTIKGDKQNSSILGLKIKNIAEVKTNIKSVKETLEKLGTIAEENKAAIYESQDNIFFILAPIKTRTFQNEKRALKMAQEIQGFLIHHNKIFKQKIDFGIALNYGTIIAKSHKGSFEFMSMGDLMAKTKKISSIAKSEILLGEKIKDKLGAKIKTEKLTRDKTVFYKIKEIRDTKENEKFIRQFLDRLEKK